MADRCHLAVCVLKCDAARLARALDGENFELTTRRVPVEKLDEILEAP